MLDVETYIFKSLIMHFIHVSSVLSSDWVTMYPTHGPVSGGSSVTIVGTVLPPFRVNIEFATALCDIFER